MGDFLAELFDQFDQEAQAGIRAAEDNATRILAQGTAAAKGRRRVAESLHDSYWLVQPENDAQIDSGGVVFVAYVNALWRKTDAEGAECIDDFLTKVEELIEPILTTYGDLGKGLIEELRAGCRRNARQVNSMLRASPASPTSSTDDSAAISSQDEAGHAGGRGEAPDASEQSDTETDQTREADRLVISAQPVEILGFSDPWRKRVRQNEDCQARSARQLGRNPLEAGRQEGLLRDARAWAKAALRELVQEVQDLRELKERVVKQTEEFIQRHRYYSDFRLGYREFQSALWEEEWPSLEDCALEAVIGRANSAASQSGSVAFGSPAEARGEGRARLAAIPPLGMEQETTAKPKSIESIKAGIVDDISALITEQRSTLTWEQQMIGAPPPPRTFNLDDPFEADLFSVLERGAQELTESAAAEAVQQEGGEILRFSKRSAITEPIYEFLADRWLNTGFDFFRGAPGARLRTEPTLTRLREDVNRALTKFSLTQEGTGVAEPGEQPKMAPLERTVSKARTASERLTEFKVKKRIRTHEKVAEGLGLERSVYFDLKAGRKVSEETYIKAALAIGCSPDDLKP
jgi:hypothetical protein